MAAGRHIPMVVENVKGAQKWVGRARWSFGSFYLWGDVPALMPITRRIAKRPGHDWNRFKETGEVSPHWRLDGEDSVKNPGFRFDGTGRSFQSESVKNTGGSWFKIAHNTTSGHGQNPDGRLVGEGRKGTGTGTGAAWFDGNLCQLPSNSRRRKMASAMIAKIPLPLSRHIGATFR